jgi:hypothetical protein
MAGDISNGRNGGHGSSGDEFLSQDELQADAAADVGIDAGDSRADPNGAPPEPPGHGAVQDAELIEMLKQLSETIDEANTAFAEQQELVNQTAASAGDPAEMPPRPSTLPPAVEESRYSAMAFTAAGVASLLAVAAVGATWLFLNSHDRTAIVRDIAETSPDDKHAEASSLGSGGRTTISRRPDTALEPTLPVEKPIQEALKGAADPAPAEPRKSAPDVTPVVPPKPVDAGSERDTAVRLDVETAALPETAVQEPVKPEPAPPVLTFQPREEAAILERGSKLMTAGDIAAARLVFEYGAARGSADAMFELGRSYDPAHLRASGVIGIAPDAAKALKWYVRAAGLGHGAAQARADELEKLARN